MRGTIHTNIGDDSRRELARFKGGMMFELGCHQIDRVVDLLGRPGTVKSWLKQNVTGTEGLADNTLAVITTSARMPGHTEHRSLEVIGSDGAVLIQSRARKCA